MDLISGSLIEARLKDLARFTSVPGEMTRLSLSPVHRAAVDHLIPMFEAAGMSASVDGAGSLVGHFASASPGAKTLILGSHIDTVRNAGIYDGNFGVIAALSVIESLHAEGRRLPFHIELVAFADEEGARFPSTLTSARALAGRFDPASLADRDRSGLSRAEALAAFGAPVAEIDAIARPPESVLGYIELHIEQGPVLEAQNLPVGIVTAINGCSRGIIEVEGVAGHAGTLPMPMRHDAMTASAEMILAIEACGRSRGDLVATVGVVETAGGAVNVVPGRVRFTLDVRSPDDGVRLKAVEEIRLRISEIADRRAVRLRIDLGHNAPAAPCDAQLSALLERAVAGQGVTPFRLPSGAGHDGMALSGVFPIAMLFTRCRAGISHNPAEYASPEDMGLSARVLRAALLDLAGLSPDT